MTVRELIDELNRLDPHSRVGVQMNRLHDEPIKSEVDRVIEDHSGSKLEALLVGMA